VDLPVEIVVRSARVSPAQQGGSACWDGISSDTRTLSQPPAYPFRDPARWGGAAVGDGR
jgi:hypothetical protein